MYKALIIALFMVGCATTKKSPQLEKRVKQMEWQINSLNYMMAHEKCFISYNMCKVDKKKDCWKNHETCVILTDKMLKHLLN